MNRQYLISDSFLEIDCEICFKTEKLFECEFKTGMFAPAMFAALASQWMSAAQAQSGQSMSQPIPPPPPQSFPGTQGGASTPVPLAQSAVQTLATNKQVLENIPLPMQPMQAMQSMQPMPMQSMQGHMSAGAGGQMLSAGTVASGPVTYYPASPSQNMDAHGQNWDRKPIQQGGGGQTPLHNWW